MLSACDPGELSEIYDQKLVSEEEKGFRKNGRGTHDLLDMDKAVLNEGNMKKKNPTIELKESL